ncbi:HK97-gp10 family putative phage morphogenesis protein [Paenibacillus oryzisoli]|uniref:HK97 gp10 family phage protein n=1 Tax=Paenibacillus oryzisoli TaxID=1850517 RepID=A0A198AIS3_9BACL|nr:HK97-gp10 family putative phage morphogenesis protein [Paenibacillus oryzisoli]OAS21137.1 hypothetical protein A8708_30060 [Paenibacillus oryzisoli]
MANSIDLDGIDALLAELRTRAESAVAKVEKEALQAAGEVLAADMVERAVRSKINRKYHIEDNIAVSKVKKKDGVKFVTIGPNRKVSWRAHFTEFGTSNQRAEPFIYPAFNSKKIEALQVLADKLREGLQQS